MAAPLLLCDAAKLRPTLFLAEFQTTAAPGTAWNGLENSNLPVKPGAIPPSGSRIFAESAAGSCDLGGETFLGGGSVLSEEFVFHAGSLVAAAAAWRFCRSSREAALLAALTQ